MSRTKDLKRSQIWGSGQAEDIWKWSWKVGKCFCVKVRHQQIGGTCVPTSDTLVCVCVCEEAGSAKWPFALSPSFPCWWIMLTGNSLFFSLRFSATLPDYTSAIDLVVYTWAGFLQFSMWPCHSGLLGIIHLFLSWFIILLVAQNLIESSTDFSKFEQLIQNSSLSFA